MFMCSCEDCQRATGAGHSASCWRRPPTSTITGETRSFAAPGQFRRDAHPLFLPALRHAALRHVEPRAGCAHAAGRACSAQQPRWYAPNQLIFARSHRDWDLDRRRPAAPRDLSRRGSDDVTAASDAMGARLRPLLKQTVLVEKKMFGGARLHAQRQHADRHHRQGRPAGPRRSGQDGRGARQRPAPTPMHMGPRLMTGFIAVDAAGACPTMPRSRTGSTTPRLREDAAAPNEIVRRLPARPWTTSSTASALILDGDPRITEKNMFGGLTFLLNGHILVGCKKDGRILLSVGKEHNDEALARPGATQMSMAAAPCRLRLGRARRHRGRRRPARLGRNGRTLGRQMPMRGPKSAACQAARPRMQPASRPPIASLTDAPANCLRRANYSWQFQRPQFICGKQSVQQRSTTDASVSISTLEPVGTADRSLEYRHANSSSPSALLASATGALRLATVAMRGRRADRRASPSRTASRRSRRAPPR